MEKPMKNKIPLSQDSRLEALLLQRGEDIGTVGLRDLNRYYALLNHHLLELCLTSNEANLICEALKNYRFEEDPDRAIAIWKQIDTAIQQDRLDLKWSVNSTLIGKLKVINHLQAVAIVDAVERYWIEERSDRPHKSSENKLFQTDLIKCCDSAL
ncbi:hypothetical protein C7B77_22400 [Chamaesiphon polymorphus CCALA 037]|uniref:Uncharacterized protein n=2 Tax=Chamaesiphon TaxID=217161 RepID=A0A2T1G0G6_9CYAN|nr:hypothetical protein C7B77_22400 [Chamaesiphon polymorphus CCALA 037]